MSTMSMLKVRDLELNTQELRNLEIKLNKVYGHLDSLLTELRGVAEDVCRASWGADDDDAEEMLGMQSYAVRAALHDVMGAWEIFDDLVFL